jgi:hypothetical protein
MLVLGPPKQVLRARSLRDHQSIAALNSRQISLIDANGIALQSVANSDGNNIKPISRLSDNFGPI